MDAHAQFVADDNQLVVFLQQELPFVFGHLQGGLHIAAVVVKNIRKPQGNAVEQHGAFFQGDASQVLFLLHGGPLWTPVALVALDALAKVLVPVPGRGQIHRLLAACFGQLLDVGTLAGTLSPADKGDCHRFLVLRKSRELCRCTAPGTYRTDNQILDLVEEQGPVGRDSGSDIFYHFPLLRNLKNNSGWAYSQSLGDGLGKLSICRIVNLNAAGLVPCRNNKYIDISIVGMDREAVKISIVLNKWCFRKRFSIYWHGKDPSAIGCINCFPVRTDANM